MRELAVSWLAAIPGVTANSLSENGLAYSHGDAEPMVAFGCFFVPHANEGHHPELCAAEFWASPAYSLVAGDVN